MRVGMHKIHLLGRYCYPSEGSSIRAYVWICNSCNRPIIVHLSLWQFSIRCKIRSRVCPFQFLFFDYTIVCFVLIRLEYLMRNSIRGVVKQVGWRLLRRVVLLVRLLIEWDLVDLRVDLGAVSNCVCLLTNDLCFSGSVGLLFNDRLNLLEVLGCWLF